MIIGITGWMAAGKDTVADYLIEKRNFQYISLSDIIRDVLREEGKELTRDNLREKGNELRDKFGPEHLAKKALEKIALHPNLDYVVPSIRQSAEVRTLRENPDFVLWAVVGPIEERFARMQKRNRGDDALITSLEVLKEKEEAENGGTVNCQEVGVTVGLADVTIDNSGTFDELYAEVDKLISEAKND
jgi:dephospho-CoA kinase